MFVVIVAVVGLATGCATATREFPVRPIHANLDAVLAGQGCYSCLREVWSAYDSARREPGAAPPARAGAFATAILLAAREKELGLAATTWIEAARSLAASPVEAQHLAVVEALPWERARSSADFEPSTLVTEHERHELEGFLDRPAGTLLDRYLRLALACQFDRPVPEGLSWVQNAAETAPILRYRLGACTTEQRSHLEAVATQDARYVEARFFLGRYALEEGTTRGARRTAEHLRAAQQAFPDSAMIVVTLADACRAMHALDRALTLYDRALALRPNRRDALLGRTIVLSDLARHDEASAAATRLLELGAWFVGDAYYWRAWNAFAQGRLERAREDVERAKPYLLNDDVLTLSGAIAVAQHRSEDARRDLEHAHRMNGNNCIASKSPELKVEAEMLPAGLRARQPPNR